MQGIEKQKESLKADRLIRLFNYKKIEGWPDLFFIVKVFILACLLLLLGRFKNVYCLFNLRGIFMRKTLIISAVSLLTSIISSVANASVFTVTNTNDSGPGSFRQAILDNNEQFDVENQIVFNIPGAGPHVIYPLSELPDIDNDTGITINASTQPGGVELDGHLCSSFCTGLTVGKKSFYVKGLIEGFKIRNFAQGIGMGTYHPGGFVVANNEVSNSSISGIVCYGRDIKIIGNKVKSSKLMGIVAGLDKGVISNNTIEDSGWHGLLIRSSGNLIQGNKIQNNGQDGIHGDTGSVRASIVQNTIVSNGSLGINLNDDGGVTPNDFGDTDATYNFPVLKKAVFNPVAHTLKIVLDLDVSTVKTKSVYLEFYVNSEADSSGHGEGEIFIGSANVVVDAVAGPAEHTVTLSVGFLNQSHIKNISATATESINGGYGATSEFSGNINPVTEQYYDFGDAPDPAVGTSIRNYNTVISDSGAYHLVSDLYLGSCVDGDDGSLQNSISNADDQNKGSFVVGDCSVPGDDENGVKFFPLMAGTKGRIEVSSSGQGYLSVWFDWNNDGDWQDVGEQVVASKDISGGVNSFSFKIPPSGYGTKYVRVRLNKNPGIGPIGGGSEGEVEDYRVNVGVADSACCEGKEIELIQWVPIK